MSILPGPIPPHMILRDGEISTDAQTPPSKFTRPGKKTYHGHHNTRVMALTSALLQQTKDKGCKRAPSVLTTVTSITNATDDDSIAGATITRHPSPDRISVGIMADLADVEAQLLQYDKDFSPSPQLLLHDMDSSHLTFDIPRVQHNASNINPCDFDILSEDLGLAHLSNAAAGTACGLISPPLYSTMYSDVGSYSATPNQLKREYSNESASVECPTHGNHKGTQFCEEMSPPEVTNLLLRQNTGAPHYQRDHSADNTLGTVEMSPISPDSIKESVCTSQTSSLPGSTKADDDLLSTSALSCAASNTPSNKSLGNDISADIAPFPPAPPKAEHGSALYVHSQYFDSTGAPLPVAYYHHPEFFFTYVEETSTASVSSNSRDENISENEPVVLDNCSRGWAVANLLTSYFPNPSHRSKSPMQTLVDATHKATDPKLVSFTQVVYAMALLKRLGAAEEKLKQKLPSEDSHFPSANSSTSSFFGPASARRAFGAALLLAGKVHEDRYPRASAVAAAVGLKMKKAANGLSAVEAEQSSLEHLARTEAILLDKLQWSVHVSVDEYATVYGQLMDSLVKEENEISDTLQ